MLPAGPPRKAGEVVPDGLDGVDWLRERRCDPNRHDASLEAGTARAKGATRVGKEELLGTSDVVSIHQVLSARTRGLVGAGELALLKPGALLVNTSRAPIIDGEAHLAVLRQRADIKVALDVFDEEPLPLDHPLRSFPPVLMTPHIGYVTEENYRIFYADAVEDIQMFLKGTPIRRVEHVRR